MQLIEKNIRARDVVTRKALENAARVVARAWSDPAYAERLRADATSAIGNPRCPIRGSSVKNE